MLPSSFEFHNPVKIISGYKVLDNLPYELSQMGAERPLIITDRGVVEAGLVRIVRSAFDSSGMTIGAVYDDVPPDSSVDTVNAIADVYRKNQCDSLVAVGGGSPIDTAKGVNILVSHEKGTLKDYMGADRLSGPLKPLVVVPTTAGTGSEVTLVAVIADTRDNVKMAFVSRHLMPDVALLDPRMTLTMPAKITASTGMDALSHAMEAWVGLQKNPLSDAHATAAITLIRHYLPLAIADGKDRTARLALANASCMAGAAFSNSMVGMVHALGHAAGAVCHIPHGVAMGIFLPHGLRYNLLKRADIIGELLLPFAGADIYAATPSAQRADRLIALLVEFQRFLKEKAGLPMRLKDAGVRDDQLGAIALKAINDGALMMNPAEMDMDDARRLLAEAF
ncbi:iron-containing alcohol dehydrogenase [Desulfobotulus sp. H1]|uniref:Iron-containing alcohol dehydrogenase n=1 Tax=Desulfobotulus pelophilus TaxID=2823377 RepID=A0ABT3N6I7_9BACT|nr:iron-containing alcohol dehydrogenase [Desulfobotulus pelophilus]MCW7753060.1 iron-containing alcohol dehydrogenase [Desulfobotulus pelophilus]